MGYLGWILIFFFPSNTVSAENLLEDFCDRVGGEIVKERSCPKYKWKLKTKSCVFGDSGKNKMFFNGCSGPSGGHAELFYPACIRHDLCYHHEPATTGLSKIDCDNNFRTDLLELCEQVKNRKYCQLWANMMYQGVKRGGSLAFNCHNEVADYQISFFNSYFNSN